MIIGGMDIATTSGFACLKDERYETATFRANVKKSILEDAKSLDAAREGEIGRKFSDFVQCWLIENRVDYVGIEQPIPSNPVRKKRQINVGADFAGQAITYSEAPGTSMAAIFRIYALEGIAASICSRMNIPVVFVHQGTWRKSFLGSGRPAGNAKQEAVKMCKKLGIEIGSADAAEAVGIAYHLNLQFNPLSHRRANDLFGGQKSISVEQYRAEAEKLFSK